MTFTNGAFRGCRVTVVLVPVARRRLHAAGRPSRVKRTATLATGCKLDVHIRNLSSLLTNIRLCSHTRRAQQAALGVLTSLVGAVTEVGSLFLGLNAALVAQCTNLE